MSPNEARKLLRRYYDDVLNGKDPGFADTLFLPTAVLHDPAAPEPVSGPEGIKQMVKHYRVGFPDLKWVLDQVIVEGDLAATRWTATGTHRGAIFGIAPTNKFGTVTGISFMRFEKDRVAEAWAQWDVLAMLKNMGVPLPIKLDIEALV